MKKILLLLVILAVGVVGFTHWKLRSTLQQFAAGTTLQLGTTKFSLPPLANQATRWLPPAVELGDLDVGVQIAAMEPATLQLQRAHLTVDLLSLQVRLESDVLRIRPDGATETSDAAEIKNFAFVLSGASNLTGVMAQQITFFAQGESKDGAGRVAALLSDVRVIYIPGPTYVPTEVRVQIGEMRVPNVTKPDQMALVTRPLELSLTSRAAEPMRTLQDEFTLQGVSIRWNEQDDARTLEIKPLTLAVSARMRELTGDEWRALYDTLRSKVPNWKDLEKEIDGGKGSLKVNAMVTGLFDFLLSIGIVPESTTMAWEGFTLQDGRGRTLAQMQPTRWSWTFAENPKGVHGSTNGQLGDLTFEDSTGGLKGEIAGMTAIGQSTYPEPTYAELLKNMAVGVRTSTHMAEAQTPSAGAAYLTQLLAQWATVMDAKFTMEKIQTVSSDNTTTLRNGLSHLSQDGTTLKGEVAAEVVQQTLPAGWPAKQIDNGKARLTMEVATPWQAWHALSKKLGDPVFPATEFFQSCVRQPHRVALGLEADAGSLGFSAALQTSLTMDASALNVKTDGHADAAVARIAEAMTSATVQNGELKVDLRIDHLTALQHVIDAVSPGSSEGLLLQAKPFVQVDTAKDSLVTTVLMSQGKWTVNGQPQPMLDAIIQGMAE